MSLVSFR